MISTASFDGHVTVSSVMGSGAASSNVPDKVATKQGFPPCFFKKLSCIPTKNKRKIYLLLTRTFLADSNLFILEGIGLWKYT